MKPAYLRFLATFASAAAAPKNTVAAPPALQVKPAAEKPGSPKRIS